MIEWSLLFLQRIMFGHILSAQLTQKKKKTRKKEAVGTEILGQQVLIRLLGIFNKPRRRR